jgi:hypothetical protein
VRERRHGIRSENVHLFAPKEDPVNLKLLSATCAAAALSAAPLLAGASGTVATGGQITANVSATVVKDCKVDTTGALGLSFGTTINALRGTAPDSPTATFNIKCNNGTQWHLAADANGTAPVDLTSTGYSATFASSTVGYNVTAGPVGGTASDSAADIPIALTATLTTADPPVGTYSGSFVISVMI